MPYGSCPYAFYWSKRLRTIQGPINRMRHSNSWKIISSPARNNLVYQTKQMRGPDRRIWLNQSSWVYTAKTGYYGALEKNHPEVPAPPQTQQDWLSDVWKVQMASKLKLLIWKIKYSSLPVGELLIARMWGFKINSPPILSMSLCAKGVRTCTCISRPQPYASSILWSWLEASSESCCPPPPPCRA